MRDEKLFKHFKKEVDIYIRDSRTTNMRKIIYNRLDAIILLYSIIIDKSFVDACKILGVDYKWLQRLSV